ncbi:AI-2E family transporter [Croceicoccus estronivorus]|uniref:AI-2E family transporter n=1 Tax=Croceicoccus estronivorus TaxID=1172626 RepID=UPI0009EEA601|nr:AI-2E family transporter [Croceicoccus estronivorus]
MNRTPDQQRQGSPPPLSEPGPPWAAQEVRLTSALVLLLGIGLFLALPFILSIGAVVFLPLVAAIILTIVLSPLADRLAGAGLPNLLASALAVSSFIILIALALGLILQPAINMVDEIPTMVARLGEQFSQLRGTFRWLGDLNEQLASVLGREQAPEVMLATPSMLEEVALATPSLVLEIFLTLLLAFFMIESRVRLRRRLLLERATYDTSVKAARALRDIQDRVAAYILTVSLINLCVGILVAFGAWAMGIDAPIMWGGLAAILNFLPYVGPLTMVALLGLFGLGTSTTFLVGLIPAATYLTLHLVESNILTPAILGARFTMNPVLILLALSYFSWIWGFAGALLSVPILLTLTALFDHVGHPNLIGFLFGEPLFGFSARQAPLDDPPTEDT